MEVDVLKLSYEHLNDAEFMQALDKLDNYSGWDSKTSWDYNRIKKAIDNQLSNGRKELADLTSKFTEKKINEDGTEEMVFIEKDGKKFPKITDEDTFNEEFRKILSKEFEIKSLGIDPDKVSEAGLTNREIRACEAIFSENLR